MIDWDCCVGQIFIWRVDDGHTAVFGVAVFAVVAVGISHTCGTVFGEAFAQERVAAFVFCTGWIAFLIWIKGFLMTMYDPGGQADHRTKPHYTRNQKTKCLQ